MNKLIVWIMCSIAVMFVTGCGTINIDGWVWPPTWWPTNTIPIVVTNAPPVVIPIVTNAPPVVPPVVPPIIPPVVSGNVPNLTPENIVQWVNVHGRTEPFKTAEPGQFHGEIKSTSMEDSTNIRYGIRGYFWEKGYWVPTGPAVRGDIVITRDTTLDKPIVGWHVASGNE